LVSDGEVDEIPTLFTGDNLFEIDYVTPALIQTGTTCTNPTAGTYSCEPTGVGYNPQNGHVFISDDSRDRIFEVDAGADGLYGTSDDVVTNFRTREFGSLDPEGVTYCPDEVAPGVGVLYIADGVNREVYRVDPGPNQIFDGIPALGGDDIVTGLDVSTVGLTDVEGIACDTDHPGHLYVSSEPDDTVFHITTSGTLVRTITVLAEARRLAGLSLGPSSLGAADPTPTLLNLYIADRGVDNDTDPNENDGKIYEYSLTGLAAPNDPPQVGAGGDQWITSTPPAVANLNGTVTDDGLPNPPGAVTTTWSQVSGPSVTFGNPNAVDTTVTLSAVGVYVLELEGDDGDLQGTDQVTITVQEPGSIATVFVSTSSPANPPGLTFEDEDIAAYDLTTGAWSMYFDGSDVGLGGGGLDVTAFHIEADGSILLSINVTATLPGVGLVEPVDIVRFIPTSTGNNTAGTFELVFDGSDVELGDTLGEDIDALGRTPDGRIVLSTTANFSALGVTAKDEDLLVFNDTELGPNTSGSWTLYFDGSDVALDSSPEDVNGAWVDDATGDIYLSFLGEFVVPGASGDGLDIVVCVPGSVGPSTSCTYSLFFDGSANGLTGAGKLDGVSLR
jgi:hypothetical protein